MRAHALIILGPVFLGLVLGGCTDDLDAPYNYELGTTTGPGVLEVSCGELPQAAVGAEFAHTLAVMGGEEPFTFAATLPDGLVLDASTGAISGIPTTVGDAMFDLTVTDSAGDIGMTTCSMNVRERVAIDLAIDTVPYCLTGSDTLLAHIVEGTGDGSAITCEHTGGSGNGKMPAGISVDAETCAVEGTVTDTRFGTWAFVVRGTQSGAEVFIPYCVTNDTPAAGTYPITVEHTGSQNQELAPFNRRFNPDAIVAIGETGDPLTTVTDNGDCPGNSCSYSFQFFINASPFDLDDAQGNGKPVIVEDQLGDDGTNDTLQHGIRLSTNEPVAEEFRTRAWVVNLDLDYCFSEDNADCDTAMPNPQFNAFHEFSVIMVPDPG
jgi:hypothetical protein